MYILQLSTLVINAQRCEELFEVYGKKMFNKDELVYIPNESLGSDVRHSCEELRKHVIFREYLYTFDTTLTWVTFVILLIACYGSRPSLSSNRRS
jgi:hypothetical protein